MVRKLLKMKHQFARIILVKPLAGVELPIVFQLVPMVQTYIRPYVKMHDKIYLYCIYGVKAQRYI